MTTAPHTSAEPVRPPLFFHTVIVACISTCIVFCHTQGGLQPDIWQLLGAPNWKRAF